jgi:hypothetical protein
MKAARRSLVLPYRRDMPVRKCTFGGRQNTKLQHAVPAAAALHGGTATMRAAAASSKLG